MQESREQFDLTVRVCSQGNNRIHTQSLPGSDNAMDCVTSMYCSGSIYTMHCSLFQCSGVQCSAGHCGKLLVSQKREIESAPWNWHHLTVAMNRLWAREFLYCFHMGN